MNIKLASNEVIHFIGNRRYWNEWIGFSYEKYGF